MTWGLQQRDLPILSPGQMNPFNQALSSGLDTYKNLVTAGYQIPKLESDINYKNMLTRQNPVANMLKAYSDPTFLASMTPEQKEQYNAVLSRLPATYQQGGSQAGSSIGGNQQGNQQAGGGSLSGLYQWAHNLIHGDSNPPAATQPAPQAANGAAPEAAPQVPRRTSDSASAALEPPAGATEQQRRDWVSGNPASGVNNPPPSESLTYSEANLGHKYPGSAEDLKAKRLEKETEKTAELNTAGLYKLKNDSVEQGKNALQLESDADKFHEAYKKAFIKGPAAGYAWMKDLARYDSDAYAGMNSANNMAVSLASQLFGNKQSDYREKLSQTLKMSLDMPEKTEQKIHNGIMATAKRTEQYNDFVYHAESLGIKDPNKINNLWFDFNKDVRPFDIKKGKIIQENLTDKAYKNYLNDKINGRETSQAQEAPREEKTTSDYVPHKSSDIPSESGHKGKVAQVKYTYDGGYKYHYNANGDLIRQKVSPKEMEAS